MPFGIANGKSQIPKYGICNLRSEIPSASEESLFPGLPLAHFSTAESGFNRRATRGSVPNVVNCFKTLTLTLSRPKAGEGKKEKRFEKFPRPFQRLP
jgi:hypothetical protein